jgi:hypothetical protein
MFIKKETRSILLDIVKQKSDFNDGINLQSAVCRPRRPAGGSAPATAQPEHLRSPERAAEDVQVYPGAKGLYGVEGCSSHSLRQHGRYRRPFMKHLKKAGWIALPVNEKIPERL